MKIDKKLNLVFPIYGDHIEVVSVDPETKKETKTFIDNVVAQVHATPISKDVFEKYVDVLAKTFTTIYGGGYSLISGPRIALLILKKVAASMGDEVAADVDVGLIGEIRRLTNVLVSTPNGWETVTFAEALAKNVFSEDDASEVENAIAFFTVASSMHVRAEKKAILEEAARLWGGRITSSTFTEFRDSLPKSTAIANSGGTETTSLVPG